MAISVLSIIIKKATITGTVNEVIGVMLMVNVLIYVPLSIVFYFPSLHLTLESALAFVASGILASFLYRIFLYSGIERIGPSRTISISRSAPLFATMIAVLTLGEFLTFSHFLSILFIVVGVVVLARETATTNVEPEQTHSWINLLFPIGAAVFAGVNSPISRFGFLHGAPVPVALAIKVVTAFVLFAAYLSYRNESLITPLKSSNRKWYVAAGITNTVILALFYSALSVSRVVVVAPIFGTSPLFVLVLSYFFLPRLEKISSKLILGAVLVVTGTTALILSIG